MTGYSTVQGILEWSGAFHQRLAEIYRGLALGHEQERIGMLLVYLAEHEEAFRRALKDYEGDASFGLAATWHSRVPWPSVPPESVAQLREMLQVQDTADVVQLAIEFHDALILFYSSLRDQSGNDSTHTLFAALADMEIHEKLRMVRDAQRLEDY